MSLLEELTPTQAARLERDATLRTLWKAGVKAEAISAELGIEYNSLRKACARLGLPPRKPGSHFVRELIPVLSERQKADAYALWRNGLDTTRIATRLNALEAAVYNSLHIARGRARA